MKKYSWWTLCATLGPVGYLPAPGTVATFLTLPVVWFVRTQIIYPWQYAAFLALFSVIVFICIDRGHRAFPGRDDPSCIVLDESLGTFITFWVIPVQVKWFIIGFLLFRFFDILKICGIKRCEQIKGTAGIMLDDIVAALLSNLILQLIIKMSLWSN